MKPRKSSCPRINIYIGYFGIARILIVKRRYYNKDNLGNSLSTNKKI